LDGKETCWIRHAEWHVRNHGGAAQAAATEGETRDCRGRDRPWRLRPGQVATESAELGSWESKGQSEPRTHFDRSKQVARQQKGMPTRHKTMCTRISKPPPELRGNHEARTKLRTLRGRKKSPSLSLGESLETEMRA
jgi:hypothetical protein